MKTEINTNTLITQIIDAEQMIAGVNDDNLWMAIKTVRLIKQEAENLGNESSLEKKIHKMIDMLEVSVHNKITQRNLAISEEFKEDQLKEDENE